MLGVVFWSSPTARERHPENTTVQIECTKEKHMNVDENYKFKVLRLLRTILHRIGLFLATRARFCVQQGTTNEFSIKFDRKVSSLTAQFRGKKQKKIKILNWASQGILDVFLASSLGFPRGYKIKILNPNLSNKLFPWNRQGRSFEEQQ